MSQITRTDIHRPSEIIPANYQFVGISSGKWEYAFDAGATSIYLRELTRVRTHMAQTGGKFACHQHGGTCMVCGAHAIYLAVFYHPQTNEYVKTGMDCAEKMHMGDPDRFRRLRDAITAAQKARTGWKKAEGILLQNDMGDVWEAFLAVNRPNAQTLEGALRQASLENDETARLALHDLFLEQGLDPLAQPTPGGYEENTISDIVGKLIKYGSISSKQMSFLRVLLDKISKRPQVNAQKQAREQKWAEEKTKALDVPTGTLTITLTVLKTEWRESQYGSVLKMLGKAEEGFNLWGTVPSHLGTPEKGTRIRLTASVEQSPGDPKFGFFSRPRNASIVG